MNQAPPTIFAPNQTAAKWSRSRARLKRVDALAYLAEAIADDVADRLEFMRFNPQRALVVGDMTGQLSAWLEQRGAVGDIGLLGEFQEERPGPSHAFDLIVHTLGLGMVNDLPGALIHARNALADGGLFIAAFPGAGSLTALRHITLAADGDRPAARMHPLVDSQAATGLLQRANFARQVVDTFPINVRYSSFDTMMSDLRDHGLTRSLAVPSPPITKAGLERARNAFDGLRDQDGKVTERFEILVLTGWKT